MLEELDFAAGSDSEGEPVITMTWAEGEEEEEEEEGEEGEDEEMSEMERRELVGLLQGEGIEEDDGDDLWQKEGLEDGELRDLMADAENGEINDFGIVPRADKEKKKRRGRGKKEKATATVQVNSSKGSYAPLTEPAFFASTSKRPPAALESYEDDDTLGDPTSLNEADASDKERRKRSLRFHTSKIAATSARRNAARTQRLGGDEDLPYRDRKAARDAALRKNGPQGDGGEALEPVVERKRARDVIDDGDDTGDGVDDGEGYYDLVKRRRKEEKAAKEAEHEAVQTARL